MRTLYEYVYLRAAPVYAMVHLPRDLISSETGGAEPAGRVLRTEALVQMTEDPRSASETEREGCCRNTVVRKVLPRYPKDSGINHDIRVLQSIDSRELIREKFRHLMARKTDELSFTSDRRHCLLYVENFDVASLPHHSDRFHMMRAPLRSLTSASAPALAAARPRLNPLQVDQ